MLAYNEFAYKKTNEHCKLEDRFQKKGHFSITYTQIKRTHITRAAYTKFSYKCFSFTVLCFNVDRFCYLDLGHALHRSLEVFRSY